MNQSNSYSNPYRNYRGPEEHLRLIVKVARMYHERNMRQGAIADELHISQPRVSRLLRRGTELGIVRTIVSMPTGVFTDLEEQLEERFGLQQAVVVDVEGDERDITTGLGAATAEYLSETLIGGDLIGVSSWSACLLSAVDSLPPFKTKVVESVVQVVGGLGNPRVEVQAAHLISKLAADTGAEAVFMPAPGVLGSAAATKALMSDPSVASVMEMWRNLSLVLVGIGALEPSEMLRQSGNTLDDDDLDQLREGGAVGDICLRFFDAEGQPVNSELNDRIVGISAANMLGIPRRVGVAGGERKYGAILGALRGQWVSTLITDVRTARRLIEEGE